MTATYPDPNLSTAAREWADRIRNTSVNGYPTNADCYSAAELILSLPDTVVDGDKLREVIADWGNRAVTSDTYTLYQQVLALLPAPPSLPTLAELIEDGNDPQKYQWMACEVKEPDSAPTKGRITFLSGGFSYVLFPSGISGTFADNHITPRPDLPRPEDVPAGEPWIVQHEDREWSGVRAAENEYIPWSIISMDGLDYRDVDDSEITLISRLVREVSRG